jgi:HSP20 family protein
MSVVKWEPFRDLMALQDRMGRLFGDSIFRPVVDERSLLGDWMPAVDIYEDAESITIQAELPGMEMKDIDVKVEDNRLTLSGERKLEQEEKRDNYHRIERVYGSFYRNFALPTTVEAEKIRAAYERGILKVTLPKREETKPKKIKIDVT